MDPIGDMINMMKNASLKEHVSLSVPFSKVKSEILSCLKENDFIKGFEKKTEKGFPVLNIELAYSEKGTPKINGVERVSKPSRRMYIGVKEISSVKSGRGLVVLSTPKGILSGMHARKEHVGGEVLFNIW